MQNTTYRKIKACNYDIIAELLIGISFFVEIFCLLLGSFMPEESYVGIALFINVYVLFFIIILDLVIMGINKHFPIFAFYCCFFVFLLGRKFVYCFNRDIASVYNSFSTKFIQTVLYGTDYLLFTSLLYFSLMITFVVYKVFMTRKACAARKRVQNGVCFAKRNKRTKEIQRVAQIMAWITAVFALAEKLIILKAQSDLSYVESYQTIIEVPVIIKIFNNMFEASVFIFFATLPKKQAMWPLMIVYIVIMGILPTINGNRAQMGIIFLLVTCYLLVYSKINKKKFKFRWLLYTVICGVGLICVFWIVGQMRDDATVQGTSVFAMIEDVLDSLGGSDSLIAGIIVNANKFPKSGIVYLFYPVKATILDNPIMRLIIGFITGQMPVSYPQGMQYLLHNDSFSHWFSFICSPELYLAGSGSGSSYIAECYFAFGFWGVVVISVILGVVLMKISSVDFSDGKVYRNALSLFFVSCFFFLPRNSTFAFAYSLPYFLFTILVCDLFVYLIYKPSFCQNKNRSLKFRK